MINFRKARKNGCSILFQCTQKEKMVNHHPNDFNHFGYLLFC